jgi:hypothetical protein
VEAFFPGAGYGYLFSCSNPFADLTFAPSSTSTVPTT